MAGVWSAMNAVNCADVPDPSERITGLMASDGKVFPGLSAAMSGWFQFVISAVKIFAAVVGDSWRSLTRSAGNHEVIHERRAAGDDREGRRRDGWMPAAPR
jgi:hypothetical protein